MEELLDWQVEHIDNYAVDYALANNVPLYCAFCHQYIMVCDC